MPLAVSELNLLVGLLVLAEFCCLALLGFILVQMMQLESGFMQNKDRWLAQIKLGATQLRFLRRKLETFDGKWPQIPMGPSLKRKWQVFRWVCKALSGAKWVRS